MSARLIQAAEDIVASISFDVNGILLPTGWRGGNGGLVSQETIKKADALRRAIDAEKRVECREQLLDRIDGLSSDLDGAVEVAWKRGATEWVRLNYPAHYKRFTDHQEPQP